MCYTKNMRTHGISAYRHDGCRCVLCRAGAARANRRYRAANRDKILESKRLYRDRVANKAKIKESRRRHYLANREAVLKATRLYYAAHREAMLDAQLRYYYDKGYMARLNRVADRSITEKEAEGWSF